ERPRIALFEIFLGRDSPYRGSSRLRATAARAEPEPSAGVGLRCAMQPVDRRGNGRVDAVVMMRIAAEFDKGSDGIGRLGLPHQDPLHAAAEDLPELPGVKADIGSIGAVDRRLDDDGRCAVTRTRWAALDETPHVLGKARHVERAMLHSDI